MSSVTFELRILRQRAVPRITVRKMAELLDMPLGTYARYESEGGYKKPYLPLAFTRKVAGVLSRHQVDPAEVMRLAGLNEDEAEPEGRQIEATSPAVSCVLLPVLLPNAKDLKEMFEGLLAAVPAGSTREETAQILAERLPTGFAAIGFAAPLLDSSGAPVRGNAFRSRGKDRHAN